MSERSERTDGASDDDAPDEDGPQEGRARDRSEQGRSPGVDALQAAAREAIDATRALLDVAEALVNDPEMADRLGSVVRAATGAATRAARAAGTDRSAATDGPDDDGDGVQRIPVS